MKNQEVRIISGGQTGADRAGIQFALENHLLYGGWVPKDRRSEDGVVPEIFTEMRESSSSNYKIRTEMNVVDGHVTLVFTQCPFTDVSGGSWVTIAFAKHHKKPWKHINVADVDAASQLDKFLTDQLAAWSPKKPEENFTINVAGSRESKSPGIQAAVLALLKKSHFFVYKT